MQDLVVLDWVEILEIMKTYATSESGREAVLNIKPLNSEQHAYASFQEIASATAVLQQGLRPSMSSLDYYSNWILRLKKKAVLKTLEIKDILSFLIESLNLKEALQEVPNDWAQLISASLMETTESISYIERIITPGGEMRSDASETLLRLFREKERLAREVQQTMERLVTAHQMENVIQDKYVTTRDGRWVIPVKSGMQHRLPGVIHGSSQTKQTVFIEPDKVIPTNNRLRQIDVDIEDEIERILTELSRYLSSKSSDIESTRLLMAECDLRFAQAQFSVQAKAHPIHFSQDKFELVDVRHPLLQLSKKEIIANTVFLESNKGILLLSGPNAGGKTVLLKSIGLAAQMARCGLLVCAGENSRIPFFKEILVGIGDAQSVDEELSTFAAHLKVLSKAANLKGRQNLVLIDEICGSTDPEEGSALARAFIETMSDNNIFGVITSHLGPLKSGWDSASRILNGSLEYDAKTGRPTYQFISGIPGDSLAIQTAKRVGVNPVIVERALAVLSPATQARLRGLDEIERLKSDISTLQDHLRKETNKALEIKNQYQKQLEELNKNKELWLERTLKKAERKVEEAIVQAKVADTFQRHTALQQIKYNLPEIVKVNPNQKTEAITTADEFAKAFPPGTKVFISSMNQEGIVQGTPNAKGDVMVLVGALRVQLKWQDLRTAGAPKISAELSFLQSARGKHKSTTSIAESDRTLDLRGKTIEEALIELEDNLDKAILAQEDRIKIIHGHGTDALKRAVRTFLSRSLSVKNWKAGSPQQGGDGVTWAELTGT